VFIVYGFEFLFFFRNFIRAHFVVDLLTYLVTYKKSEKQPKSQ